jgi:NADP-dependent 3-hydroxy acid dehydrogenase YdfG
LPSLASHNREEVQTGLRQRFGQMTRLEAQDIAEVIAFIVTDRATSRSTKY